MTMFAAPLMIGSLLLAAGPAREEVRFHADSTASRAEAERTMADFSKCVVENRRLRPKAEAFLRLIPETPAFRDAGVRIATPDCMPRSFLRTQLRFNAKLFRQTLYSALYQHDFGRSPPPDVKLIPTLLMSSEFDGDVASVPPTVSFERLVGDCVARADSADVHRLLATKISSDAEKAALEQVVPQLANCVPAGQRTAFSRSVLRGMLAEALYKLRKAAATPGAAQTGAD
jgi:hypothetical protein